MPKSTIIQMGHVPRTSGSTGTAGEQEYVKLIANTAADLIDKINGPKLAVLGADVRLPSGYDQFIALHCDGSTSSVASGASVGYRTVSGRQMATEWKVYYKELGWPYSFRPNNYTVNLARYYGTGWAVNVGTPRACIIEHGFLTNHTKDRLWLKSPKGVECSTLTLASVIMGKKIIGSADPIKPEDFLMIDGQSPKYHISKYQTVLNYYIQKLNLSVAKLTIDGVWGKLTELAHIAVAGATRWTARTKGYIRGLDYMELRIGIVEDAVDGVAEAMATLKKLREMESLQVDTIEVDNLVVDTVVSKPTVTPNG